MGTDDNRERSVRDKLKIEGNYLKEKVRKKTLRILKNPVEEEYVMVELIEVSKNKIEIFLKDLLYKFCALG